MSAGICNLVHPRQKQPSTNTATLRPGQMNTKILFLAVMLAAILTGCSKPPEPRHIVILVDVSGSKRSMGSDTRSRRPSVSPAVCGGGILFPLEPSTTESAEARYVPSQKSAALLFHLLGSTGLLVLELVLLSVLRTNSIVCPQP